MKKENKENIAKPIKRLSFEGMLSKKVVKPAMYGIIIFGIALSVYGFVADTDGSWGGAMIALTFGVLWYFVQRDYKNSPNA